MGDMNIRKAFQARPGPPADPPELAGGGDFVFSTPA